MANVKNLLSRHPWTFIEFLVDTPYDNLEEQLSKSLQ
jgi:hypothetical protein